ncbi:M48 family metallopeptidase [Methylocaldum szegediense]|uniref:Peptidase_M48 domain-containing protein n=1 Tax=Methylocaldum szegediense TaxID=73780 RepID=A0ABM9I384_9GAMM|nr:M48 family metallopeptidase [Methylocaldum szegediense]CAI8863075.1 Peptidase_M48 domain-containing protein [Methylocaldum szegediense]
MSKRWQCTAVVAVLFACACAAQAYGPCLSEQSRSRETARQIDREWPQRPSNDELSRYIQSLGERLGRTSLTGRSISWRFIVLRDRSPYAFSIGSGFVYIADGALSFARNESDLAAILAHEIGHQLAGHFCELDPPRYGSDDPSTVRRDRVGTLVQVIDLRKELEADQYAVDILRDAGFDPHAMLGVAERLPAHAGSGLAQPENERVLALQNRLRHFRLAGPGVQDSYEFRRLKEQIRE